MSSPKMKTLGIDLRCLPSDGSAGGGIAHAARAVTEALERLLGDRVIRYAVHGSARVLARTIRERPCDLLFVPSGAISPGLPVPAIPWVHDCDIFDHPEWFPQSWLKRQITTRLFLGGIKKAPVVFAASEYTRDAVMRLCGYARERIIVTGEGGDEALAVLGAGTHASGVRLPEAKVRAMERVRSLGITKRFVLMLGTVEPRKNIPLICRIWPEVAKAVPDVDLVIAGQDGWKTAAIHVAIRNAGSQVHLIQKDRDQSRTEFTEQDRRDLLLAADLVLVPSFSEGFGLVALEAIQAGTPVLASNRGALPEVVGKGEWLLDPEDEASWKSEMIRLLQHNDARQNVIHAQHVQQEKYSWEKSAMTICRGLGV